MRNLAIYIMVFLCSEPVWANRLQQAAENGSGLVLSIAQTVSGIGIAAGAILLSLGMAGAGRTVLGGGVVGAACSFGVPAMVDFMRSVF